VAFPGCAFLISSRRLIWPFARQEQLPPHKMKVQVKDTGPKMYILSEFNSDKWFSVVLHRVRKMKVRASRIAAEDASAAGRPRDGTSLTESCCRPVAAPSLKH
jgi:hypothetical protein